MYFWMPRLLAPILLRRPKHYFCLHPKPYSRRGKRLGKETTSSHNSQYPGCGDSGLTRRTASGCKTPAAPILV